MASPSGHKEGLRCDRKNYEWPPVGMGMLDDCQGLILELDEDGRLGTRCYKKNCRAFHPLEVLLSQALERGLLGSEQLAKIREAVAEEPQTSQSTRQEKEMTTVTKHSIEINPPVHPGIDPAGAIDAIKALHEKAAHIHAELIARHFPTFDNGELKARASGFINLLAQGDVGKVEIRVVIDDKGYYATWLKMFFTNGKTENIQNGGWSMRGIARDAAYRFQSFANLLEVPSSLEEEIND